MNTQPLALPTVAVEIEFRDGTKENVSVRELSADEMARYDSILAFEGTVVELFCNKPKGWSDTLTHESLEKLLQVGEDEIGNLKRWSGWRIRQAAKKELLMPGKTDAIAKVLTKILNLAGATGGELTGTITEHANG